MIQSATSHQSRDARRHSWWRRLLVLALLLGPVLPSNLANASAQTARPATLSVVCYDQYFVRVGAVNLSSQPAVLELSDFTFSPGANIPAELRNIFPIELDGYTLRDPAYTWDIPVPNTYFPDANPVVIEDGRHMSLPAWTLALEPGWGTPSGVTDLYNYDLKPCWESTAFPVPTEQVAYSISMVECREGVSFSTSLTPSQIWGDQDADFPSGCVLAKRFTQVPYLITDTTDPQDPYSWGLWQTDMLEGRLGTSFSPRHYQIYGMKEGRSFDVAWVMKSGIAVEDLVPAHPYGSVDCVDGVYDARLLHEITVCYLVYVAPVAEWESAHKATFPFAEGGQLLAATLTCEWMPEDIVYLAKHAFWGITYSTIAGYFFPGGVTPGNCFAKSHGGGTVSAMTEVRVQDSFEECGPPCGSIIGMPSFDSSLWAETQYYTALNPITGYQWLEAKWIGTGDYCDAQNVCMKVFIAVEDSVAAAIEAAGMEVAVSGETGQINLVSLYQLTPGCTTSRPGSFLNVYSGVTCHGFTPGEQVKVYWNVDGGTSAATLTAAWNGRAAGIFRPTSTVGAGNHNLVIKGQTSQATVTVAYPVYSTTATISLDKVSSRYNGVVTATISGFYPGLPVSLSWPDDPNVNLNSSGVADAQGTVTLNFNTPLAPYGDHVVRASQPYPGGTRTANTTLKVTPRVNLSSTSGVAGSTTRFYWYGFEANDQVTVDFCDANGSNCVQLDSDTTAANGRADELVTIPANATLGEHRMVGRDGDRSTYIMFTVTALGGASEPSVTPTKTLEPTGSPTITPTIVISPTVTSIPIMSPTPTETLVAPTELPTSESPAETASPTATVEGPEGSSTVVPTQEPTSTPALASSEPFDQWFGADSSTSVPAGWSLMTSNDRGIVTSLTGNSLVLTGEGAALLVRTDRTFSTPNGSLAFSASGGTVGYVFGYRDSQNWSSLIVDTLAGNAWLVTVEQGTTRTLDSWHDESLTTCSQITCTLSVTSTASGSLSATVSSSDHQLATFQTTQPVLNLGGFTGVGAIDPENVQIVRVTGE